MNFEELLKKVSEPTDISIFLIGFALGYIVDLGFPTSGIPAGTMAGVIAIGCLGVKKGIDSYLLGSKRVAERRRKKRLNILRGYFIGNSKAIQVLDEIEVILKARLVDYALFDKILEEKMQRYISEKLKEIGEFPTTQQNLQADIRKLRTDFESLYVLARESKTENKELHDFCEVLNNTYFPRKTEARSNSDMLSLMNSENRRRGPRPM